MGVEENKRIVQRAFEALVGGNLSPLYDLLAPDAVLHQCGFPDPVPARVLLERSLPVRRLAEREIRLERMIAEGDFAALHWRTSGCYPDPSGPDGAEMYVSIPVMTFLRLEGGKISEIWNIQDMATLQTQLQNPPAPAP